MKPNYSRRDFIELIARTGVLYAAAPWFSPLFAWANQDLGFDAFVVSDGPTVQPDPDWKGFAQGDMLATPSGASIWDLKFNSIKKFDLSFLAHKFQQNPKRPNQLVGPGKRIRRMAVCDLKAGTVKDFEPPAGVTFFGHGFFDATGKHFYATAFDHQKGLGVILKYTTDAFKLVSTSPSYGLYPHDAQVIPELGATVCAVLNVGALEGGKSRYPFDQKTNTKTSVAVIDYSDGKLLREIFVPNMTGGLAHYVRVNGSQIFAVGAGRTGGKTDVPSAALINLQTGVAENFQALPDFSQVQGEANNPIYIPDRNSIMINSYTSYDLIEIGLKEKKIINRLTVADVASHLYLGAGQMLLTKNKADTPMLGINLQKKNSEFGVNDGKGKSPMIAKGSSSHISPIYLSPKASST